MTVTYTFWNNKGGTGKTSLMFQAVATYAHANPKLRVLAVDLCPQANLSELLLGGLEGKGSANLLSLQNSSPRRTIGGYFQARLPSPYAPPAFKTADFLVTPASYNAKIPRNLDLVAGDAILELQANAMSTLANTQVPGTNTWLAVIDWLKDFLAALPRSYDVVFIDANPSFSIYTQIALATSERIVVPVMADDSSRRAVQNVFSLIHGLNLPSPIYSQHAFFHRLGAAGRQVPKVHLIVKNRLTQYMGPASAYAAVLATIQDNIAQLIKSHPAIFTFTQPTDGMVDVRDFQTTGVVAFALGCPFYNLEHGRKYVGGEDISVKKDYLDNCIGSIDGIVAKL